jgi:TM2 domain-containing membrane protein YozV
MIKAIRQRLKSKTINFGLLVKLAGALQIYLGDSGYGLATMITGLVIIWLREQTDKSVGDK